MVEFDIKAAFDQIDHGLLMKAVRSHIKEGWILLYIERRLKAPFERRKALKCYGNVARRKAEWSVRF